MPRLTLSGTTRSDGTWCSTFIPSASSTSLGFMPTFEFARLRTSLIRSRGKDSISSVCSASFTFFSVGTSSPHRRNSSSVRSSVASIGPWKNGDVSTMIASYDSRATSSSRASFASVTSSASSGRNGAGRISSPHGWCVT